MKVKELIKKLQMFNPKAKTNVVVHNSVEEYSITYGNAEGITKGNCEEVSFYVDRLCQDEAENLMSSFSR